MRSAPRNIFLISSPFFDLRLPPFSPKIMTAIDRPSGRGDTGRRHAVHFTSRPIFFKGRTEERRVGRGGGGGRGEASTHAKTGDQRCIARPILHPLDNSWHSSCHAPCPTRNAPLGLPLPCAVVVSTSRRRPPPRRRHRSHRRKGVSKP